MLAWLAQSYPPQRPGAGIGDDAAILDCPGGLLAITTDAVVEGVHFRREWLTWQETGGRAACACLSDLAAMRARPLAILLSIGLPSELTPDVPQDFVRGAAALAESFGAALLGGDTVSSPTFFADVVGLGALQGSPWLRSGGRPGDVLAVTGGLGGPAAAVALLEAAKAEEVSEWLALRRRFVEPRPRVAEALALGEAPVSAAMDVSDGLLLDASRLAEASGCGAEIIAPRLPIADGVEEAARLLGARALDFGAAGGEEYELLVAMPSSGMAEAEHVLRGMGCPLTAVGRLVEGSGVRLVDEGGQPVPVASPGWLHGG